MTVDKLLIFSGLWNWTILNWASWDSLFTCPLVLVLVSSFCPQAGDPSLFSRNLGVLGRSPRPQILVLTQSHVAVGWLTVDLQASHPSVTQFILRATMFLIPKDLSSLTQLPDPRP